MAANLSPASQAFPLDAERADRLAELVRGLDAPGLLWISGYAAGMAAAGLAAVKDDASAKDVVKIAAGSPDPRS